EWVHVQLHQQKGMISLSPPTICNSAANLMLSVMGAFAEFERALIRERQREGIVLAKQRGAYRGRKKSLNSEQIAELKRRVAAGDQKTLVARDFGISRETLYQYLRED
ncbi:recombinase family protein, partial [Escherichia coli]|uniref:recombinase family protein n=1 Tax=Escherichia coli TaxID=562 RepID=UPI001CECC940